MLDIDQVYVLHYSPLSDRKRRLLETLPFDSCWIEEEPTVTEWTQDEPSWVRKAPTTPFRPLKMSEISLTHKHILAYRDILKKGHERALILEDDVVFSPDFTNMFNFQL